MSHLNAKILKHKFKWKLLHKNLKLSFSKSCEVTYKFSPRLQPFLNSFSNLWMFHLYRQILHRNTFTSPCVSMCLRTSEDFRLITLQIGHLYVPIPSLCNSAIDHRLSYISSIFPWCNFSERWWADPQRSPDSVECFILENSWLLIERCEMRGDFRATEINFLWPDVMLNDLETLLIWVVVNCRMVTWACSMKIIWSGANLDSYPDGGILHFLVDRMIDSRWCKFYSYANAHHNIITSISVQVARKGQPRH